MAGNDDVLVEDRTRCDHPFHQLELHSAKRHIGESMCVWPSSAILYCNKCKTYIHMSAHETDWNSELYSKILQNGGTLPDSEYPWWRKSCDPDDDQMTFVAAIKWLVSKEQFSDCMQKPEILAWMWTNEPQLMVKLSSMMASAAVSPVKK